MMGGAAILMMMEPIQGIAELINEKLLRQHQMQDLLPLFALGSFAAAYGLSWLISCTFKDDDGDEQFFYLPKEHQFKSKKRLSKKDQLVVDMLSTHEDLSWVVTDPEMKDNEIVYASPGFCRFTGYRKEDIEGKNCRFLQGPKTDPKDVALIRNAIKYTKEASICLLNYRKDGTPFHNQFFLMPMYDANSGKCVYFLGVQVAVGSQGPGQEPSNPGWVYALCQKVHQSQ